MNNLIIQPDSGSPRTTEMNQGVVLRLFYSFANLSDDTHFGFTNSTNAWLIKMIVDIEGSLVTTYANELNNPTLTTIADAWAARGTLTYESISDITLEL